MAVKGMGRRLTTWKCGTPFTPTIAAGVSPDTMCSDLFRYMCSWLMGTGMGDRTPRSVVDEPVVDIP